MPKYAKIPESPFDGLPPVIDRGRAAWIRALKKYGEASIATRIVYGIEDKNQIKAVSRRLLKELRAPIQQTLEYMGLDTIRDVKDLARLRKAKKKTYFSCPSTGQVVDEREDDDHQVQLRALDLCLKLKGATDPRRGTSSELADQVLQIINNTTINIGNSEPAEPDRPDCVDAEVSDTDGQDGQTDKPILPKEPLPNGQKEQIGVDIVDGLRVH